VNLTNFQKNILQRPGLARTTEPCGHFVVVLSTVRPTHDEKGEACPSLDHPSRLQEKEFEALVVEGLLECDGQAWLFLFPPLDQLDREACFMVYMAKITAKGTAAIS